MLADLSTETALCRIFSDSSRLRLLALLATRALTVRELTEVTALSQSRISSHLKMLREAGLVTSRRQGAAAYYRQCDPLPTEAGAWWAFACARLQDPLFEKDAARADEILATRAGGWADAVAGQMSRRYSPGRTWESFARGALGLSRPGRVLDIAAGDGALAGMLAPRAHRVICADASPTVVRAGARRFRNTLNLNYIIADMNRLPFAAEQFDTVLLLSALCHSERPQAAVAEAARVLAPGGLLVGVALASHEHRATVAPYGHRQMGFDPAQLRAWLEAADLNVDLCAITQHERRSPRFEVITFHAHRSAP